MKILHIVSSIDPKAGGVTQAIKTMINGLKALRVVNEVVCLDDPDSSFLKHLSFAVHPLGPAKTSWKYAPALLNWLKENLVRFDVLIVHGLWQYHTYAAYLAFRDLKVKTPKVYVMPHGMLDPYFQKASGRKLKALRNLIFWKFIEHKLVNSSTGILFTSEAELSLAEKTFVPYCPQAKYIVGLGVEPAPPFSPLMETAFEEKAGSVPTNFLLFLGRIDQKKGVDLLIKAYLKLREERDNVPPLVIAGPGIDSKFGVEIIKLVNNNKYILLPGMLSGAAKWGAFYLSGAFILPSHQENFGIAVVEALSCGKPVLISNQVNIWKEIETGGAGIVDNDNESGTYKILKNWLEKTEKEREDMCIFAKHTFNERFSVENATACLTEALNYEP
jgi:glycosyltransferase involved in cell wall biosynthesis